MLITADGCRAVLDPSLTSGALPPRTVLSVVRLARGPVARFPGSVVELQSTLGGRDYRLLGRMEDGLLRVLSVRERALPNVQMPPMESEAGVNSRPALTATITWDAPVNWATAQTAAGGGVYIIVKGTTVQKVGLAARFQGRMPSYSKQTYGSAKFHLGRITLPDANFDEMLKVWARVQAILGTVEHAVSRVFLRSGARMPRHDNPQTVLHAQGLIEIKNVLPPTLVDPILERATTNPTYDTKRKKTYIGEPSFPVPAPNVLRIPEGKRFELFPES